MGLCLLFFFLAVRVLKRAKSNTVVLTGLSGSGKTVLFYQVSVSIAGFIP
jgi:adenylylsulfate kinase-like enzyme